MGLLLLVVKFSIEGFVDILGVLLPDPAYGVRQYICSIVGSFPVSFTQTLFNTSYDLKGFSISLLYLFLPRCRRNSFRFGFFFVFFFVFFFGFFFGFRTARCR